MRRIVPDVAAVFHRETGCAVELTVGTVGALTERAAAGGPGDVLVLTDTAIDALTGRGIVEAGSRVDLARTAVGVGVRRGARCPTNDLRGRALRSEHDARAGPRPDRLPRAPRAQTQAGGRRSGLPAVGASRA